MVVPRQYGFFLCLLESVGCQYFGIIITPEPRGASLTQCPHQRIFVFSMYGHFLVSKLQVKSTPLMANDIPTIVKYVSSVTALFSVCCLLIYQDGTTLISIILSFYMLKKKKQEEVGHRDEAPNSYTLDPMNNGKPIPTT